jgi:pimeloyl-ACP methyl ester carboxylesterase
VILSAHPADAYNQGTAALLAAAAEAQVVCVNPRGVGGSTPLPPGVRYTLEDMVDDLDAVRVALGISRWTFWGLSGGGWLAQLYARRHAAALDAIVLESACACFRERLADPECLASPFHPRWHPALASAGLLSEASGAALGDDDESEWTELPDVGQIFRRRNGPALLISPLPQLPPALMRIMPRLFAFDSRAWLTELDLPTLVVCGSVDPIVPLRHGRALHEAIRGAELVIVEGAGHVPVTERRVEVADSVRRFLAQL